MAALRESPNKSPSGSQSEAEAAHSAELTKSKQEIHSLREELKSLQEAEVEMKLESNSRKKKNKRQKKSKPTKGGANNANPKPAVPSTPSGSQDVDASLDGAIQSDNPGDEGNAGDDFKVMNRKKPRKLKPRSKG